jgi:hypothetical protein
VKEETRKQQEETRRQQNAQRLQKISPTIRPAVALVIADMEADGHRPLIHENVHRTIAEQLQMVRRGVSKTRYSYHNATTPDGRPDSLAADIVDADQLWNVERRFWMDLCRHALARGLRSGYFFGLTLKEKQALLGACERRDYGAKLRTGWDAAHVQTARVTIEQARQGLR